MVPVVVWLLQLQLQFTLDYHAIIAMPVIHVVVTRTRTMRC